LSPHVTSVPGRQRYRCCKCVSRTARRAHARRSCLNARTRAGEMATFAMHKRMYNQERGALAPRVKQNAVANRNRASPTICVRSPGAGGVSPPWVRCRDCTNVCEHTDGSLLRLCGSIPACTFFNPHGGLTFTALDDDDRRSRRNRFSLQVRYSHPRRADARRSWLCVRSSLNNIRFSRHTDRTTEPRRADARSSCFRT
jgi:hypothetical protein